MMLVHSAEFAVQAPFFCPYRYFFFKIILSPLQVFDKNYTPWLVFSSTNHMH